MIIMFFILFLFLSSFSLGISILLEKEMKYTIPFSMFSIILFMYICGIVIPLNIAFYLLLIIYFIIIGISLFKSRYNLKKTITKYCGDGTLLLYFILFLIFVLFNFSKHVAYIDEYKHWASVVKAMFSSNELSFKMDYLMYPSYPPAISLLQYTMMKLVGSFHESILYLSFYLFGSSLFLPFIQIKRKNFILSIAFILLVPTVLFINYYNCIYVDGLIGMLFAHSMVYIFINSKKEIGNFEYVYIALSLIGLSLLKDIGFIFSLISIIYLGICLKLNKKKSWRKYIIVLVSIILARISWSILLFIFEVPLKHQNIIGYKDLINLITFNPSTFQLQVINQFIQNIINLKVIDGPINLHYYGVVIIFGLIFYLIYISDIKFDRKKFKYLSVLMISGMIFYPILLLFTYLFQFDYFEAIRLSSYERYIVIFINAVLITIILCIIYFNQFKTLVISCCIICLFVPINQFSNWVNMREEHKDWSQISYYALESKVLIYDYKILDSEISRIKYEIGYSKISLVENVTVLNSNINLDIKDYDYIYFINVDTDLKKDFNIEDNSFYKVDKDKNSVIKLNHIY